LASFSPSAFAQPYRELAERERDRAAAGERVDKNGPTPLSTEAGRAERRERPQVDRHRGRRQSPAASICASKPPVECPNTAGFLCRALMISVVVIGDLPQGLLGQDARVRPGLFNRSRIVWPVRRQRRVAACLKKSAQLAQLLGSSHRPWMKTTGVWPNELAASISRFSRSEIDAMRTPLGRVKVNPGR